MSNDAKQKGFWGSQNSYPCFPMTGWDPASWSPTGAVWDSQNPASWSPVKSVWGSGNPEWDWGSQMSSFHPSHSYVWGSPNHASWHMPSWNPASWSPVKSVWGSQMPPFHPPHSSEWNWRSHSPASCSPVGGFPHVKMAMHEEQDKFVLTVMLPGANKDWISVTTDSDNLCLKYSPTDSDSSPFRGISTASFTQMIPLSKSVATDKVKAKLCNGVLSIELPKKDEVLKSCKKVPVEG